MSVPSTTAAPLPAAARGWEGDVDWVYPVFSAAERDRRWGRVRELMAAADIECIVAGPCTGVQGRAHADVKYLTQLGTNDELYAVVFPLDGAPVVIGWPGKRPGDDWIDERRGLDGGFLAPATWGRSIAKTIAEIGLGSGRVAIGGLTPGGPDGLSMIRQTEGYLTVVTHDALREHLPRATFVDAGSILGAARYVKGPEEIEFIRIGVSIAERSLYALVSAAHTRAYEPQLYAQMLAAQLAVGGSLPTMISWSAGPLGAATMRLEQPVSRRLKDGDLISTEIEGRWAGYNGQIDATVAVGAVPEWAHDAHEIAVRSFRATVAAMAPGVTFGHLRHVARDIAMPDGFDVRLIMHGRGLGEDGPLVGVTDGEQEQRRLEPGTCFAVKPGVLYRGQYCARVGDTVVVDGSGAHRLGRRTLEQYWHVD